MGGYGSTRWNFHNKRLAVEDCRRLPFRLFKRYLQAGMTGQITWSQNGEKVSSIGYQVNGWDESALSLSLIYTVTRANKEKIDCNYQVRLTATSLPWGGLRHWFICPGLGCGRRVGVLYLAPGGLYFVCRHCNHLSYRSRQEGYSNRSFYIGMAKMMQDLRPGTTWRDVKEVWKD